MIKKILAGFRCDEALRTEIETLAASPSVVDQAIAVGLVGSSDSWQPTSAEVLVRSMMGDSPIDRAHKWAETLKAPELGKVWTERGETYSALRDLILSVDERRERSEGEKAKEEALRRRLHALSFVIEAQAACDELGEGLDETIFLPAPAATAAA